MKSKSYLCKMDSGTCIQNTQLNLLQLKIIKLEHMHIPHTQTHMCRHMYSTHKHICLCVQNLGKSISFFAFDCIHLDLFLVLVYSLFHQITCLFVFSLKRLSTVKVSLTDQSFLHY